MAGSQVSGAADRSRFKSGDQARLLRFRGVVGRKLILEIPQFLEQLVGALGFLLIDFAEGKTDMNQT